MKMPRTGKAVGRPAKGEEGLKMPKSIGDVRKMSKLSEAGKKVGKSLDQMMSEESDEGESTSMTCPACKKLYKMHA
jgi:hypothetical protein